MKKLIILRGLPGSGKSTIAEMFGGLILSADDLRYVDGKYTWEKEREPEVWEKFKNMFLVAIRDQKELIVIDNTNISISHFEEYSDIAKENGYDVFEIIVGDFDIDLCLSRGRHSVPKDKLEKMKKYFQFQRYL